MESSGGYNVCPICNNLFPMSELVDHSNKCVELSMAVEAKRIAVKPKEDDVPLRNIRNEKKPFGDEDQQKALEYFAEKRKREEDDERLAKELMEKEEQLYKSSTPAKPISTAGDLDLAIKLIAQENEERKNKVLEQAHRDAIVAREIYEKEEARAMELRKREKDEAIRRDELMAKELFNREKEEEEAKKRKKDLEASDAALAKALKEKDDLEAELERLRRDASAMTIVDSPFTVANKLPKYWVKKQGSSIMSYEVYPGVEEWNKVMDPFYASIGVPIYGGFPRYKGAYSHYGSYPYYNKGVNVVKVTRNQNLKLWTYYTLKAQEIASKTGTTNEQWLYHGSRAGAYDTILKDGFDIRVASMSGAYGAGIYFATAASTSRAYCTTLPNGNMAMLICKVILGSVGTGQNGLRRPPPKHYSTPNVLHDSVSGGGMYVVFDNIQAYPMYLVEFNIY